MALQTVVASSLGGDARIRPRVIGEDVVVFASGNYLRFESVGAHGGSQSFLWPAGINGFSALACNAEAKLVAAASRGHDANVTVYSYATRQPTLAISGFADLGIAALAFSRGGKKLAVVGAAPSHTLTIWDAATGAAQPGPTLRTGDAVTSVSFCPTDELRLCVANHSSLRFYSFRYTHEHYEPKEVLAAKLSEDDPTSLPRALDGASGDELLLAAKPVDATLREPGSAATFLDKPWLAQGTPSTFHAGIPLAPHERRACWLAHAWLHDGSVAACNAFGDVAIFDSNTGAVLRSVRLKPAQPGPEDTSVVAAGIAYCKDLLVCGCSDGTVRFLSPVDLSTLHTVPLRSSPAQFAALPAAGVGALQGHLTEEEALPAVHVEMMPSYQNVLVWTARGTLHTMPVHPAQALARERGLHSDSPLPAAVLEAPVLAAPPSRASAGRASDDEDGFACIDDHADGVVFAGSLPCLAASSLGHGASPLHFAAAELTDAALSMDPAADSCYYLTIERSGLARLWSAPQDGPSSGDARLAEVSALRRALICKAKVTPPARKVVVQRVSTASSVLRRAPSISAARHRGAKDSINSQASGHSKASGDDSAPARQHAGSQARTLSGVSAASGSSSSQAISAHVDVEEPFETSEHVRVDVADALAPGVEVTCVAVHRKLPLIAVGSTDGAVAVLVGVRVSDSATVRGPQSATLRVLHRDYLHGTPVTRVAFCDGGNAPPVLASLASDDSTVVFSDLNAMVTRGPSDPTIGYPLVRDHSGVPAAFGVVRLPSSAQSRPSCIAWAYDAVGRATLFVGTASGHLMSLTLPGVPAPNFALPSGAVGQHAVDMSSLLRLRARLPTPIVAMAGTYATPPAGPQPEHEDPAFGPVGDGALFVAMAGERAIAIIPYDSFHLAFDPLPADESVYTAVPATTAAVLSLLTAHRKPALSVAISPTACTPGGCLLITGGADGAATLWAVSMAAATPATATTPPTYAVQVAASSYLPLHAGELSTLTIASSGRVMITASTSEPSICVTSIGGEVVDALDSASAAAAPAHVAHGATALLGQDAILAKQAAVISQKDTTLMALAVVTLQPAASGIVFPFEAQGCLDPKTGMPLALRARLQRAVDAAAAAQHEQARAALLQEVEQFRSALRQLIADNETAPEDEKLQRKDFIIDQEAYDSVVASFDAKVAAKRAEYSARCAELDEAIRRVKEECWTSMDTHACQLRSLAGEAVVHNFPLRKRSPQEARRLQRVALLRAVERAEMTENTAADKGMWFGLASAIPADADWIYHCGLLPPTLDPVAQLEDVEKSRATGGNVGGASGGAAANGAKPGAGSNVASASKPAKSDDGDADEKEDDPEAAVGGVDGDGARDGENAHGHGESGAQDVAWEGAAILPLLYHPAAVRSPAQKRLQMLMMQELVRGVQARFNAAFDKIRADKVEVLDGISTRNARLREILAELGEAVVHITATETVTAKPPQPGQVRRRPATASSKKSTPTATNFLARSQMFAVDGNPLVPTVGPTAVAGVQTLVDPVLLAAEVPESVLHVSDAEVGLSPYVSEAERARMQEEEERKKKQASTDGDDAPQRALDEMMGGTLEGKDELVALQESLQREPWMDTLTEAQMTTEQKTALAVYNAKVAALEEERVKRRNALSAEMNRLVTEIRDIGEAFDEKVAALARARALTAAAISGQELYVAHLSLSVQRRQEMTSADNALEAAWLRLVPEEEAAAQTHEAFKLQVDAQTSRLEDLLSKDRALERGFREHLREGYGGTIDADVMRVLQALFKKRPHVIPGYQHALSGGTAQPSLASPTGAAASASVSRLEDSSAHDMHSPGAAARRGGGQRFTFPTQGGAAQGASAGAHHQHPPPSGHHSYSDDPFAGALDTAVSAAEKTAALHEAVQKPLLKSELPEGYGAIGDDARLWTKLNELRTQKIASELEISAAQATLDDMRAHLASLAAKYESLKAQIDDIGAQREALANAREVALNDAQFLIRFRMGQDEVAGDAPFTDYADAMLLPADVIESVNVDIRKLGGKKVDILTDIKDFRKNLLYMQWERQYLQATLTDLHEFYRDLQLMRAMGNVGEFIKGINVANKARNEADKAGNRLAFMKQAHARLVEKLQRSASRVSAQLQEKRAEVERLQQKRSKLQESVSVCESIVRTREALHVGAGDDGSESYDKMKVIAAKTRLTAISKAQRDELTALRTELERLRQKSFPSFPEAAFDHTTRTR